MPAKFEIPILIVCLIILVIVIMIYNNTKKPSEHMNELNLMKNVKIKGTGCIQNCYNKHNNDPWVTASCIDKCNDY